MKNYIYTFIFLICCQQVSAQTYAGFMGKKNMVNISCNFGLSSQTQTGFQSGLIVTNPVFKFETEAERTLDAKKSFGISFRMMNARFDVGAFNTALPVDYYYYSCFHGGAKLRQFSYGLFYKLFINKRGGFSPQGKYVQLGLNYHSVKVLDNYVYSKYTKYNQ